MRVPAGLALAVVLAGSGCEDPGPELCEEDIRAQVLADEVEVELDDRIVLAELADEAVERDRGWRHRLCDRAGLLLVPDAPPEPLPIWGCALAAPVDALFIVDGQVAEVERIEPCPEPCSSCPSFGQGLEVEAVLELPLDPDQPPPAPGTSVSLNF